MVDSHGDLEDVPPRLGDAAAARLAVVVDDLDPGFRVRGIKCPGVEGLEKECVMSVLWEGKVDEIRRVVWCGCMKVKQRTRWGGARQATVYADAKRGTKTVVWKTVEDSRKTAGRQQEDRTGKQGETYQTFFFDFSDVLQ